MESFVNAILGLILGTLFGGWIERILYRPKVRMEVKGCSIYEHENGAFASVLVVNRGATAALKCRGAITFQNLDRDSILDPKDAISDEKLPYKSEDQLLAPKNFGKWIKSYFVGRI